MLQVTVDYFQTMSKTLILGYSDTYRDILKSTYRDYKKIQHHFEMWLYPKTMLFVDKISLPDIVRFIQLTRGRPQLTKSVKYIFFQNKGGGSEFFNKN